MTLVGLIVLGIVLLVVAYYLPAPPQTPPPLRTILLILGWICLIIGFVLLIFTLLGLPTTIGARG